MQTQSQRTTKILAQSEKETEPICDFYCHVFEEDDECCLRKRSGQSTLITASQGSEHRTRTSSGQAPTCCGIESGNSLQTGSMFTSTTQSTKLQKQKMSTHVSKDLFSSGNSTACHQDEEPYSGCFNYEKQRYLIRKVMYSKHKNASSFSDSMQGNAANCSKTLQPEEKDAIVSLYNNTGFHYSFKPQQRL